MRIWQCGRSLFDEMVRGVGTCIYQWHAKVVMRVYKLGGVWARLSSFCFSRRCYSLRP